MRDEPDEIGEFLGIATTAIQNVGYYPIEESENHTINFEFFNLKLKTDGVYYYEYTERTKLFDYAEPIDALADRYDYDGREFAEDVEREVKAWRDRQDPRPEHVDDADVEQPLGEVLDVLETTTDEVPVYCPHCSSRDVASRSLDIVVVESDLEACRVTADREFIDFRLSSPEVLETYHNVAPRKVDEVDEPLFVCRDCSSTFALPGIGEPGEQSDVDLGPLHE